MNACKWICWQLRRQSNSDVWLQICTKWTIDWTFSSKLTLSSGTRGFCSPDILCFMCSLFLNLERCIYRKIILLKKFHPILCFPELVWNTGLDWKSGLYWLLRSLEVLRKSENSIALNYVRGAVWNAQFSCISYWGAYCVLVEVRIYSFLHLCDRKRPYVNSQLFSTSSRIEMFDLSESCVAC